LSKIVHISDAVAHRLDVIRTRRRASYTEAIEYLLSRSRVLSDLQRGGTKEYDPMAEEDRRKAEERKYDAQREAGAAR
jgi:hypothetical protein